MLQPNQTSRKSKGEERVDLAPTKPHGSNQTKPDADVSNLARSTRALQPSAHTQTSRSKNPGHAYSSFLYLEGSHSKIHKPNDHTTPRGFF